MVFKYSNKAAHNESNKHSYTGRWTWNTNKGISFWFPYANIEIMRTNGVGNVTDQCD